MRLCGVAADGPYQASGFRGKLVEALDIVETGGDHLALPVTWDPAHILNLANVGEEVRRLQYHPGAWERFYLPTTRR